MTQGESGEVEIVTESGEQRCPTCGKSDRFMRKPGTCSHPFHDEPFRHGGARHMKQGCPQCEAPDTAANESRWAERSAAAYIHRADCCCGNCP